MGAAINGVDASTYASLGVDIGNAYPDGSPVKITSRFLITDIDVGSNLLELQHDFLIEGTGGILAGTTALGGSLAAATFTSNSWNFSQNTAFNFYGAEEGNTYVVADPVPEPSGALLAGIGCAVLLRRRRR